MCIRDRGRTAWRIIRSGWGVEVNVGLTLLNRLDNGCLSAATGYEVELGVIDVYKRQLVI